MFSMLQDCVAIAVINMQDRVARGEFDPQLVYPEICKCLSEYGPASQKLDLDKYGIIIRDVNMLAWNHMHSGDFTDGQAPSTLESFDLKTCFFHH